MILEGVVTTTQRDGRVNISPMGPEVTDDMTRLVLKPYRSTRTYLNLKRHGEGVFHVTDDVELLARAAIARVDAPVEPARRVKGYFLPAACRFYEFRVLDLDDREDRTLVQARVVHAERLRDFFGYNRARHAVIEAAILATRIAFLPPDEILRKFDELKILVDKTGGAAEERALAVLRRHVESARDEKRTEVS